jgi:hypothetical protein
LCVRVIRLAGAAAKALAALLRNATHFRVLVAAQGGWAADAGGLDRAAAECRSRGYR